jgi:hypothetical protein
MLKKEVSTDKKQKYFLLEKVGTVGINWFCWAQKDCKSIIILRGFILNYGSSNP